MIHYTHIQIRTLRTPQIATKQNHSDTHTHTHYAKRYAKPPIPTTSLAYMICYETHITITTTSSYIKKKKQLTI